MKISYAVFICLNLLATKSICQKKVIDVQACDEWESLEEIEDKTCLLSSDANFTMFKVYSEAKGTTTVLKDLRLYTEKRFHSAYSEHAFDGNRRFSFQLPGDSLVIFDTWRNKYTYLLGVKWHFIIKSEHADMLAYFAEQAGQKLLVIWDVKNMKKIELPDVQKYWFDKRNTALLIKGANGLTYVKLAGFRKTLVPYSVNVEEAAFSHSGKEVAYIAHQTNGYELRYINIESGVASVLTSDSSDYLKNKWKLEPDGLAFNNDDGNVFFKVSKVDTSLALQHDSIITHDVNVWSYQDLYLQDRQLSDLSQKLVFTNVINVRSGKFFQVESDNLSLAPMGNTSKYFVLITKVNENEFYWNQQKKSMFLFSTLTGNKVLITESRHPGFSFIGISPNNKFLVWFDGADGNYYSYNIISGTTSKISDISDNSLRMLNQRHEAAAIIAGADPYSDQFWINGDDALIVNAKNDIWQLDPLGVKSPVNLTNGYGAANGIRFRLINVDTCLIKLSATEYLGWAFDERSKQNGFWKISLGKSSSPIKLVMSDDAYFFDPLSSVFSTNAAEDPRKFKPIKALNKRLFIVRIMNSSKAPNLYHTADFKNFKQITDINPNRDYVWMSTKLITWTMADGQKAEGILHVPEGFDSTKKYPILFNYYERRSESLNMFRSPEISGHNISIPWYVSRGYLVFEPDFYYKRGKTAKSVINSIEGALNELRKLPYIDQDRMGIQGQSHGGYETNILATCTPYFAAACEMAGFTNLISEYGSIRPGGFNNQLSADIGQRNLGVFPWEHSEIFIESSPVFHVSKMRTPLLMVHNKEDAAVLFSQAIELYLAMRRIGKEIWLLQYDGEGHTLTRRENRIDFTIRMQQFFDHYLKDAPIPDWMSKGIPASQKGIVSGLRCEPSLIGRVK